MAFTQLKQLIPAALAKHNMKRQADAAFVCEKYRKLAPKLVRPDILAYTFPKSFRNGTLTIGVENSAWAHVVIARKSTIISEINAALGNDFVHAIKTTVVVFGSSFPLD